MYQLDSWSWRKQWRKTSEKNYKTENSSSSLQLSFFSSLPLSVYQFFSSKKAKSERRSRFWKGTDRVLSVSFELCVCFSLSNFFQTQDHHPFSLNSLSLPQLFLSHNLFSSSPIFKTFWTLSLITPYLNSSEIKRVETSELRRKKLKYKCNKWSGRN